MTTKLEPHETADGLTYVIGVRSVGEGDERTYEGGCSCGFRTINWARRRDAQGRIEEHAEEHRTGDGSKTRELYDVMTDAGIAQPPRVLTPFDED